MDFNNLNFDFSVSVDSQEDSLLFTEESDSQILDYINRFEELGQPVLPELAVDAVEILKSIQQTQDVSPYAVETIKLGDNYTVSNVMMDSGSFSAGLSENGNHEEALKTQQIVSPLEAGNYVEPAMISAPVKPATPPEPASAQPQCFNYELDNETRAAIKRENEFKDEQSFQALLEASQEYGSSDNVYQTLQAFSVAEPQKFARIAFRGIPVEQMYQKYDFEEYDAFPLEKDNLWALYLIHRLNNEAWKRFGEHNFTETNQYGVSRSMLANKRFKTYKYFKGTAKTEFRFLYENSSRDKVGEALGVTSNMVVKIELFIEEAADKLCICINGDRISGKHAKKQTWNKKPIEVKNLLYGVVGRALYGALGLSPLVIVYFLKKIACNIAQNNAKRVNKSKGALKGKINKVYRKNSNTRSPKKV